MRMHWSKHIEQTHFQKKDKKLKGVKSSSISLVMDKTNDSGMLIWQGKVTNYSGLMHILFNNSINKLPS